MLRCHQNYAAQEIRYGRKRVRQKLSKPYQMKFSCFIEFSFILLLLFVDFITFLMS
jgi:hypothetical protein